MQAQAENINPAEKYRLQRPLDPHDSSWQAHIEIRTVSDTLVSHSDLSKLKKTNKQTKEQED